MQRGKKWEWKIVIPVHIEWRGRSGKCDSAARFPAKFIPITQSRLTQHYDFQRSTATGWQCPAQQYSHTAVAALMEKLWLKINDWRHAKREQKRKRGSACLRVCVCGSEWMRETEGKGARERERVDHQRHNATEPINPPDRTAYNNPGRKFWGLRYASDEGPITFRRFDPSSTPRAAIDWLVIRFLSLSLFFLPLSLFPDAFYNVGILYVTRSLVFSRSMTVSHPFYRSKR